jgi:hypothetical protein
VPYSIWKWWFGIFTWSLRVSAVNAWRLRMQITSKREAYLEFLCELVLGMFAQHDAPTPSRQIIHEQFSYISSQFFYILSDDTCIGLCEADIAMSL